MMQKGLGLWRVIRFGERFSYTIQKLTPDVRPMRSRPHM